MPARWLNSLRARRRKRLLALPRPAGIEQAITRHAPILSRLAADSRARALELAHILVAEKSWEGGRDFTVTDEMKWTIAAQAAVLILGLAADPLRDAVYANVSTIIVYESGYIAPHARVGPGGVVTVGSPNLGEAWYRGPIIVSWEHARQSGPRSDADLWGGGRNLVLHEFAHKLDMLDGIIDGTPPLPSDKHYTCWREVMTDAYRDLITDAQTGRASVLDKYGTTNPAEFFAVATEAFFERSIALRGRHPDLYQTLQCYYRQDPASWPAPA